MNGKFALFMSLFIFVVGLIVVLNSRRKTKLSSLNLGAKNKKK